MDIHRYVAESPSENREYYFSNDPGLAAVKQKIELDVGSSICIFDVFPVYSTKQVLAALGQKETTSLLSHNLTIINESGYEVNVPEGTKYNFVNHGLILYSITKEDE